MSRTPLTAGTAGLLAALAGCTTVPSDYAVTLSSQDPKWQSERCRQLRMEAATRDITPDDAFTMRQGVLLGPYGIGIALAGMEHRERQRKEFVREMHLQCSSRPLPRELQSVRSSASMVPR